VAGLNPEERVGRMEWNRLFDAYKVAVTGAGAGKEEIESLRNSFSGANTPEEQAAAIRLADAQLTDREDRIRAGAPAAARQKYDENLRDVHGGRAAPVRREAVK
jgi:hypothetical protein